MSWAGALHELLNPEKTPTHTRNKCEICFGDRTVDIVPISAVSCTHLKQFQDELAPQIAKITSCCFYKGIGGARPRDPDGARSIKCDTQLVLCCTCMKLAAHDSTTCTVQDPKDPIGPRPGSKKMHCSATGPQMRRIT